MPNVFKRLIIAVELTDGRVYEDLVITNSAHVEWDLRRGRERWPDPTEAPFLWMTFLSFQQLTLDGEYTGKWPDFQKLCRHTQTIEDPAAPGEAATDDLDPTRPTLGADSA